MSLHSLPCSYKSKVVSFFKSANHVSCPYGQLCNELNAGVFEESNQWGLFVPINSW